MAMNWLIQAGREKDRNARWWVREAFELIDAAEHKVTKINLNHTVLMFCNPHCCWHNIHLHMLAWTSVLVSLIFIYFLFKKKNIWLILFLNAIYFKLIWLLWGII